MASTEKLLPSTTHPTDKPARSAVRLEIQALRAVAVGVVVVFHLWPERLPGGFVGVDVFFVISGFLITQHLVREALSSGRIAVARFWARRIRRLLPASLLVVLVTCLAALVVVPFSSWRPFFTTAIAATFYVANWALAAGAVDYWAQDQSTPPLQHYWSLSVEEQFYLVWPLMVLLCLGIAVLLRSSRRRRFIGIGLGVITLASFLYSLLYTPADPGVAYFSTFTRAWEFAAGGLLGLVLTSDRIAPRLRAALSWAGLAMIVAACLFYTGDVPFPGVAALLPVVGAIAVIAAGDPDVRWSPTVPGRIRPVQFLGDVSYSIYLWHWPLIVLLPYVTAHPLTTVDKVLILVATLVLAWATKVFVEDRFRPAPGARQRTNRHTFALAAAGSLVIAAIPFAATTGFDAYAGNSIAQAHRMAADQPACFGAPAAENPGCADSQLASVEVPLPAAAPQDRDPDVEACFIQDDSSVVRYCRLGEKDAATRVAVVGDSHAGAVAPAVLRIAEARHWAVDVYLKSGCPWNDISRVPSGPYTAAAVQNCRDWNAGLVPALKKNGPYAYVFTTAYSLINNWVVPDADKDAYATSVAGLERTWQSAIAATGTRIVVFRDGPDWPAPPVNCLAERLHTSPTGCALPQDVLFSRTDPQVEAAEATPGVTLVDYTDVFCTDGTCSPVVGGVTVFWDSHHMTRTFAQTLAPVIEERMGADLPAGAPVG